MIEPVTAIAAGSGAVVTASMLKRLLGPTADYLGERARDLVKKADENVQVVAQIALDKLHNGVNIPGEVNSRVFKNIWDEGRFVEDAFAAEYFGGLLASARTEDGSDDSALPFVSLVKSMSTYQLRTHFIIYRLVAQYKAHSKKAESNRFLVGLHLQIPGDELVKSFDVTDDFEAHLLLALNGLVDLGLIEPHFSLQLGALRIGPISDEEEDFLIVSPNERGASLFLRALGCRGLTPELITAIDVDYGLSDNISRNLQLPRHFRLFYGAPNDELKALSDEIESLRSELEDVSGKCDDLETDITDLSERVDDVSGGEEEERAE